MSAGFLQSLFLFSIAVLVEIPLALSIFEFYLIEKGETMPKVSLDIPQELLDDLNKHVGDNKKFVTQADAIRTAVRKMLDQLDNIDRRHGRLDE